MTAKNLPVMALNERRRLAVKLRLGGMTVAEAANTAELSVPTVIAAYKAYLAGGWEAVAVRPRGRQAGAGRVLSADQEAALLALVAHHHPTDAGIDARVWSDASLQTAATMRFGIEPGLRTVSRYLAQWGIRGERPELRSGVQAVDKLIAEFERAPTGSRGELVWIRPHAIRLRPPSEPGAAGADYAFLVARDNRGRLAFCPSTGTDTETTLIDLIGRLRDDGAGRPLRALWLVLCGMDLSRARRWHEWAAAQTGITLRACPLAATTTTLALVPAPEPLPSAAQPGVAGSIAGGNGRRVAVQSPRLSTPPSPPNHAAQRHTSSPQARRADAPRPIMTPPKPATALPDERPAAMTDTLPLTHLQRLEAESIHILREVVAEADKPVMLYSIGKDSAVMLHLAMKAFYPATPPFPLLHVDTGWKFRDMYAFRDRMAEELGMDLLVHINPEGLEKGINPFTHGSALHTDIMKTEGLKQALDKYGFDVAFGGARRDEEKSRAKERVFSFRTATHRWDPKSQRPELWKLYNARKHKGESIRVFPLSNWTELDVWQYIYLEQIPIVPLYYAAVRPVVQRDGTLIMVDDERMPLKAGEVPMMKKVRFRTLGCYPLTGAVESEADTLPAIIQEMLLTKTSERQGRVIDHDSAASMEKKKQEGYF